MKDTGTTIILVDFNQSVDTTKRFIESRKDSGRKFCLVSFADNFSEEEISVKLDEFTSDFSGINFENIVRTGNLEDEIEKVVDETKASALVFTLNPGGKRGFFTSPRSLKLISSLNLVFVVLQHGAKLGEIKKIAMPLELTNESKQKFEPALILAQDNNAAIDIFLPMFKDEYHQSAVNRNILWSERYLKDKNIQYTFNKATAKKDFEGQFIEFLDNDEADLVVILNYGDTFLSSLFRSTEFQIIENKYKVPVMIMNHKATYRSKIPSLGQ
jgi:hypothetical protein